MQMKRADQLKAGDLVSIGLHVGPIVRIIQESPRVLLLHVASPGSKFGHFVYRKRANTPIKIVSRESIGVQYVTWVTE